MSTEQTTRRTAMNERINEAIIAEINDPRNASESPDFRKGLRVARIIVDREFAKANDDA